MIKRLANAMAVFFTGEPVHTHTYSKWHIKTCAVSYGNYGYTGNIVVSKMCSDCGEIKSMTYSTEKSYRSSDAQEQLKTLKKMVCKVLSIEDTK